MSTLQPLYDCTHLEAKIHIVVKKKKKPRNLHLISKLKSVSASRCHLILLVFALSKRTIQGGTGMTGVLSIGQRPAMYLLFFW